MSRHISWSRRDLVALCLVEIDLCALNSHGLNEGSLSISQRKFSAPSKEVHTYPVKIQIVLVFLEGAFQNNFKKKP